MPDRPSSKPKTARIPRRPKQAAQPEAGTRGEDPLFEEIPVAMHEIDREGLIRRVNRAECELLGFTAEELLGRPVSDLIAPSAREESRRAIRRKFAGEVAFAPFCREFLTRDGALVTLEIHESYIRGEEGGIAGIRSALLDVSERQRASEELEARVKERTAELAAANHRLAIQYGVARVLAEARTVDDAIGGVLEAIGTGLGCELGVYWSFEAGQNVLQCGGVWMHREDPDCVARLTNSTYVPGEALPGRIWHNGQPLWIGAGLEDALGWDGAKSGYRGGPAFPIAGTAGTLGVAAFFCHEPWSPDEELLRTTALLGSQIGQFLERKGAETALDHVEARFAAFMDNLPGVAFLKDASGRYVYFNPAIRLLTGRDPDSMLNLCDRDIWPAESLPAVVAQDQQVMETGHPVEALHELPGPNGALRSWLIYKFPVPEHDGRMAYIGAVAVDVTERQMLEQQLRQSQKMDAVGRLAGGVAHDFNNLLTIIGGYGRMVLDQLPAGERTRGSMEQVLNAADRAAVLTSQLLAFSRRQAAQPKLIELNHVVSNVEKMLRRVIGEHIRFETNLDPRLGTVKADAGQIEQILMNLAINARDAMPQGGTLRIETGNTIKQGKAQVRLSVVDTGVGMDTKTRSQLFEPFFTTKGRGKGTGLGLSTVYGIVKQHGAEIVVESEPGAGARFHIYFPTVAGEAEAPKAEPVSEASTGTETILLVEDEAGVRRVARDTLRRRGYRVLEAADGQEAMRIAEHEAGSIHMLVTDMIMPLMNGRELARRLLERYQNLKVIFMSGYTDDVIAYLGDLGGEPDFLQKPFAPEVLARKVRTVLDAGKETAKATPRGRQ